MMRVIRRIFAALFMPVVILVPTIIGTLAAVVFTAPGHAFLARVATQWITRAVAGRVEIGRVSGDIWRHIKLEHVVIRDSAGAVILSSSRVETSYILPELLAHRLYFSDVHVDSLVLHLVLLKNKQWNYEKVFHLNEGPAKNAPSTPPYVGFGGLEIVAGSVQIDVPTIPGPPRVAVTRNAQVPKQPRIDTTVNGVMRIYTFADLNAKLSLLRISTPRREPIVADISRFAVKMSDPELTITQLAGRITTAADSLRFKFDSASLPSSHLSGAGAVRWPNGPMLFDFALDAPRVALRDLKWIQPDLPDWHGSGHIVATSFGETRTDYRLDNLSLANATGDQGINGKVRLQVETVRGLGMRDLDMQLRNTPIGVLRPFLDTLPVAGGLTGHLTADGFLDSLRLGGDLVFTDALVAGAPQSHLRVDGTMLFGGNAGAVFKQFRLNQSSIALGTIHQLVPSVLITGVFRLTGDLNGPWQNADFAGTAEHVAPDSAISRLIGKVRLDTRGAILGLALDADFDQLSFDALRSGYPTLPARGGLTGHVIANGALNALDINANLTGEVGVIDAIGRVNVNSPNFGADSLLVVMQRLDLQALTDSGMSTSINGRVHVTGVLDSGQAPRGRVDVALDRSRFGGATVDAVTGIVRADHGMLNIDTGTVIWSAGRVDAHGTLGWAAPDSGTLFVTASATSLVPFDSLLRSTTGLPDDTLTPHRFDGSAEASLRVTGSVASPNVDGTINGKDLIFDGWHAASVVATVRADSLGKRGLSVTADVDTLGTGAHVADKMHLEVSGRSDSLRVAGAVGLLGLDASGGGTWLRKSNGSIVALDSLGLIFPHQGWRLAKPSRMVVSEGQVTFNDTLRLNSVDGSGEVRVSGTTPGDLSGDLTASVRGLDLLDVFGVLQRDTTSLDGWGSLDLHLAGTRQSPTFEGKAGITSPNVGELHAPSVEATFKYGAQRLQSTVTLWKTGQKIFDGTASLPLDLALANREVRKLPGSLQINGKADSIDLVILGALIPAIQKPMGAFSLNVSGNGTWAAPGLQGQMTLFNGGMYLPSLGVTYTAINGVARFAGDALAIDSMVVVGEGGQLGINGGVRFVQLAKPTLNLTLAARSFLAIDVPAYLTLRASGTVKLTGPITQPVLTGGSETLVLSRSVIYFGDLLTKNVINLDDPENAALLGYTDKQKEKFRNAFSNRFLDSLQVSSLNVRVGNEVLLRSGEANIQVQGDLQVNKTRKEYALTGSLDTPRGTYTLRVGPINQDFTVDQGTVTYYGATNLDAILNVQAHHQVRTLDGDDFNVVASITGSIREPKVDLSSPGRSLSDRDIASYVLFGQSEGQVTSGNGGVAAASGALIGALASELQRSIGNSLSSKINLTSFTIRPGFAAGVNSTAATQFAAGVQVGRRWFFTVDAGVCFTGSSQGFQQRNFGASLEYRISREFRFQTAAEPVQTCASNRAADVFTTLNRYQFGFNLLWQRDY